jgi:hypothetical protein
MPATQPPKAYAKYYTTTALISSLAYFSDKFSVGQTGASLSAILKDKKLGDKIQNDFIAAGINIDNFTAQYEVVASAAPVSSDKNGANVVAFRNKYNGDIAFS